MLRLACEELYIVASVRAQLVLGLTLKKFFATSSAAATDSVCSAFPFAITALLLKSLPFLIQSEYWCGRQG